MYYDDADVQIIGIVDENMNLKDKLQIYEIATKFNESMRYKNIIKRQQEEIDYLQNGGGENERNKGG